MEVVLALNSREVVFEDTSGLFPLVAVGAVLSGGIALGAGFKTDDWYSVPLIALGALLLVYVVIGAVLTRIYGPNRVVLTDRGFIISVGEKEAIIPADSIEAVGLVRDPEVSELVLWYDRTKLPELPKRFRRYERLPGQLRLAQVGDTVGLFPFQRVQEVRRLVQGSGIGEWRNRRNRIG
jgi:hypothetical protein